MTERDSRPAVYREGDTIVYRASAVYSCLAALQFARTGLQPAETPADMRRRFDDSSLHEAGIVEHAAKEFGITVVGTPTLVLPITRRVIVRGTIDGQGNDLSIIEAKALSEPGWLKWRRQRWEAFPRYAWQMSVYWLGGEHEWNGPVKRLVMAVKCVSRESEHYGEIDLTEWDAPQIEYSDIAERVLTVEARVASDDEATCDMRDYPCPFFYLGDACGGTTTLQADDVLDEAFEAWAKSHRDITVQRNAIQLAYDRSREQGTRYIGKPGKVRVGDYEVTRKEYDRSYLDQKRLKRDDPVTYERYQKATHVVSIGVKEL